MTALLGAAAPHSAFRPPATVARPSLGAATIELAANFAQSALSFTPIDPRITVTLWSVAWPALCAWRKLFRYLLSFGKEFGKMKKLDLLAIKLAKFGLVMLLAGVASAHPGVEGTAIDSH